MADLKVAIAGAGGKMGAANIRAVAATPGIAVVSAFDRAGAPAIGKDAGELAGIEALGVADRRRRRGGACAAPTRSSISPRRPLSVALAEQAAKRGLVHIIGTTGCQRGRRRGDPRRRPRPARASSSPAISRSASTCCWASCKQAAAALPGFDIEILEMHHNKKVDAPSGTALMLGEAAARGRDIDLETHSVRGARRPYRRARGRQHRLCDAARRQRHRRPHGDPRRPSRADRTNHMRRRPGAVRRRRGARGALGRATRSRGFYTMADVLGFN